MADDSVIPKATGFLATPAYCGQPSAVKTSQVLFMQPAA